ncbi:MAG: mechanosensitive ion channel family protein [Candidatus Saccharimonadales bacterium]
MNDIAIVFLNEIKDFLSTPNSMRSLLILLLSILVAYWLSKYISRGIIRLAQFIAVRSDTTTDEDKRVLLRRVETYLSIGIAIVRALIVGIVAFYTWQLLSPGVNLSAATIGASAFFVVIAGATVGMILRDLTAGATMIAERWFHVGDFIRVEPFTDVGGVVERMTLRSTKLRSLNGEVIWLHNQHIQGVKVTPRGLRRLAIDIFANNEKVGRNLIEKVIAAMPVGTLKLATKPEIVACEKWGEKLWHFVVIGETTPGREWLMDTYFLSSLEEVDARRKGPTTFVRKPIARYSDERAERSFRRAVRLQKK